MISYANEWEEYSSYFEEGMGISQNWATVHFLTFVVGLGTVMGLVGVSFSLLMFYDECTLRLKVCGKLDVLPSWT